MAKLSDVYGITSKRKSKPVRTAAPKPAADVASGPGEGALVRLIFPASQELADRIDAEWHNRKLKSRSETIRVLLKEALK